MKLCVVTASIDPDATRQWWGSWRQRARLSWDLIVVHNKAGAGSGVAEVPIPGHEGFPGGPFVWVKHDTVLGPVPAFYSGVSQAVLRGADVVACLHDDLRVDQDGWDEIVLSAFNDPTVGLVGFGGARGLGDERIYGKDYSPYDLVRKDFVSNMEGAEAHGERVTEPTQVACLDGFSQIGRARPLLDYFRHMRNLGVVHHAYDSALGAYFNADGWKVMMLPIQCHHAGGQTAVGNASYQEWLARGGSSDAEQWERAHRLLYEDLRGKLPIRV